ncbi:hypothetical protein VFPPC_11729 [Pochonia chlamydosporia 170]|uniref:Uncharacterized protein n=1 Tax=Pochonia chlamydosporia 170 TaxID=1380566 RepID=A0A179EXF1_METCM|nr:hypothetical protein VFPPC_11729 [Pochonia chlamydosporia 170]OAQ57700.2 hypothetical protein VFPPC_11729 [Pochonia chlamydosporia 170]
MASEGFVHGAQYFGPGAMLWKAGAPLIKDVTLGGVKAGYGWVTAESDYFDPESNTSKYIALSAQNSGKWKRLEVPDCLSQYLYCNARTKFRDVVWVVESQNSTSNYMMAGNNSLGWSRSNMMLHMSEPEETKWSKHVPANASNSLWFAANSEKSGTMRSHTGPPHACRWHKEGGSWASAMSRRVWRWSYLLFASDIAFLAAVFGIAQQTNPIDSTKPTISQSLTNGILDPTGGRADSLVPAVLTANLPQLLLSLSYFMYNSLYTQLCIEKEWSSFSTRYRTLRVTRPQGQQRSTYRLQLPYRYSIPLILVSIILHWLVSNALYVFILEGGYFWTGTGSSSEALLNQKLPSFRGSGISGDAYVGIGYSTTALLALLFAAILLPIIPVALAMRKTTGTIPPGGSNSMVVCAACHIHVPDLVAPQQEDSGSENFFEESKSAEAYRLEVSRSPIRWGVIKLHTTLNDGGIYSKVAPGHLSFGTRDSEITEPVTGSWYK